MFSEYGDNMRVSILDAGRELFAKYGYKKTTMEDIAMALGKGKSSLYYYFKNKEEIFQAVIDWEEEILFSKLRTIVSSEQTAPEKMKKYIEVRMETIGELENYHKALKDDSLSGFDFLEYIKGKSEKFEVELIRTILDEGVKNNLFQVKSTNMAALAITTAIKGMEIHLFRSVFVKDQDDLRSQLNNVINILFYGLIKRD